MSKQGRFLDLREWISLAAVLVLVAVCLGRWRGEVPAEPGRTAAPPLSAASGQPDGALHALPVREELRIRELERLLEEARTSRPENRRCSGGSRSTARRWMRSGRVASRCRRRASCVPPSRGSVRNSPR